MFASYELDQTPNREHKKLKSISEDNELNIDKIQRLCLGVKWSRMDD